MSAHRLNPPPFEDLPALTRNTTQSNFICRIYQKISFYLTPNLIYRGAMFSKGLHSSNLESHIWRRSTVIGKRRSWPTFTL
jgi:hypothetical protein